MKSFNRFLSAAIGMMMLAFLAFATEARAQFPQCNGTDITIKNNSFFDANVCIKGLGCFLTPGNNSISVPVIPGTPVPGIYGAGNVTYPWQVAPPGSPAALWIPSVQMTPSFRCFDVYYDEPTCTIAIYQTLGPPCINP